MTQRVARLFGVRVAGELTKHVAIHTIKEVLLLASLVSMEIEMSFGHRIYLDNAATSFPKPDAVYRAIDRYNRELGVPVGRGAYGMAQTVQRDVDSCRTRAARLFQAEGAENIVFTQNCTDSLNLVLHGVLNAGDHVVTTVIEHNSILRPLRMLRDTIGISVSQAEVDGRGIADPGELQKLIRPETRLIAVTHASNVTGMIQPVAEIANIAKSAGVLVLIDAAQTAGQLPLNLRELPTDFLACAGHKGLLGPLGTGLLYVRPAVASQVRSIRQGGTGTVSEEDRQPERLPDKFESGNHNAPGLYGLNAGLEFLESKGVAAIRAHEVALLEQLLQGLQEISGIHVYGSATPHERIGVVSLNVDGLEPEILATILDEQFQIQCRSGLHCAPGAHRALGTLEAGGTCRIGIGAFNTPEDIDRTLDALREIATSMS